MPELGAWLDQNACRFDVAVFFTYLYATTTDGLPAAARHTATALVPCAHDEPPLGLHTFDRSVQLADSLLFLTPEEATLVRRRFRLRSAHHVVGLGTELGPASAPRSGGFATDHGLDGAPYLLYVGRIDPSKGTSWLVDRFAALKAAQPSALKLVLLGEAVVPPEPHDDVVVVTGADDDERNAALAGAVALVHPSPFESFAMVLTEAWALGTPVIAFAGNEVLRGRVERSGGGLLFSDGAELAAAAEILAGDRAARDALGRAGRHHVETHDAWPTVIGAWERALRRTAIAHHHRPSRPGAPASEPPPGPGTDAAPPHPRRDAPVADDRPPAWLVRPLLAALGLLAAASVVGIVAAMLEVFRPAVVVPGSIVLGTPLAWMSARALPTWRSRRSTHLAAALVLAAVAALTLHNADHHAQHLLTDRDPGIYLTTAKHLADEGDLLVPGPTGPFVDAPGASPNGAGFSNRRDDGTLEPQFPHLTAVLLGMAGWLSESGLFLLTPVIAGGALLCLYGWASGLVGPRWAVLAVLVTGTSMPFMVFARDTYSEPIAMTLVFGGLLLLHVAHRSGRWPVWLLSGLVLGATSMARVDGYLYLAPVVLALALVARLASRGRRIAAIHVACCGAGLLVTSALGWWDTTSFTGSYYDELGRRLPAMLGAAAAAAILGWLAAPLLWRRDGHELRASALLRRGLVGVAVLLAGFFAYGYWIRPDADGLPAVAQEGMNVLALLPQAGPLSMHWLEWYLGPVGLASGLAGLTWLLMGIGRRARPEPARIAGMAAIVVTLVLYLWTPSVTPDQPWAMRRFAPVALPGLAVGAAATCHALWALRDRIGAASSRPRATLRHAGPAAALAVALATLGATIAITWPVRSARAQVPMRERMADVCERLDDDDAVLVPIDGILSLMMSVPVGVWCEVPSAGGTERAGCPRRGAPGRAVGGARVATSSCCRRPRRRSPTRCSRRASWREPPSWHPCTRRRSSRRSPAGPTRSSSTTAWARAPTGS